MFSRNKPETYTLEAIECH